MNGMGMIKEHVFLLTVFFVMMTLTAMSMPVTALAHDDQKPTTAGTTAETRKPFAFELPAQAGPYTMIMGPPRTHTMRSGLVNLAPGKDVGLHSTEKNEEMLVILEGQGEVELEGFGRLKIAAGRTAYVPPKTRHNVFNTGTTPLKYLFIVSMAVE